MSCLRCAESIPHQCRATNIQLPWGPERLLTAQILEEVCRVAPADPLLWAGHVAT